MITLTTIVLTWYIYHVVKILKLRKHIIKTLTEIPESDRRSLYYISYGGKDTTEVYKKYKWHKEYPTVLKEETFYGFFNYFQTYVKSTNRYWINTPFLTVTILIGIAISIAAIYCLYLVVKYLP